MALKSFFFFPLAPTTVHLYSLIQTTQKKDLIMHPARTQRLLSNGLREGWAERPRPRLALPLKKKPPAPVREPAIQRASIIPVFHGPDAAAGALSLATGYLM
jgi:hypothetical protein